MNKKIILATVATIATIATITGTKVVYADEVQGNTGNGNDTSAVTASTTGATGSETHETTATTEQPTTEATNANAGSESNDHNQSGNATEFVKNGSDIQVSNPEVTIDQSNGNGKYSGFTVEYKNVHFPDDMQINEGDKVIFNLPKEITFQTAYEFDVKNPENNVVGKASTDPASQTVTTVFNDYFANNPLNKQMSLKLDAKWTDKVEPGKPVTVDFNGTLVTANIGKEQVIGKDELISKWGSQDKEDPTTINWTIRLNYARKVLNYVTLIDEMSENQKLVDDYFVMNYVDEVEPWTDKGSAMELIKSMAKSEHGFEIKMDRLDRMVYIWYKTKLTNAVKDSTNPTNKVELKAENDGAISKSAAHLVGGRGDAEGETKPVWEIPNDAPKYEKPSIDINDIPMMPPAPILEKPELIIDLPDPKRDEPKPQPKQDKPNTPAPKQTPKVEEVKINNRVENHAQNTRNESEETVKAYSAPATLPNTGSESALILSFAGMFILSGIARIALKREGE